MGIYDDVYEAFSAADVRYVVVGGMAVVLSGHVRATVDLDVVIDLDHEPALRAMDALQQLGLLPRVPVAPADFADPEIRRTWIEDKHMQVLSFYDPNNLAREVDVFVSYPLDFELLLQHAVPTQVGEHLVPVAAAEHLIEMKRQAGRAQDLADIEALEGIRRRGRSHER
ncbi:MAG: nucleotidyltransferase domain-containing protein [Mycobacteriales bacterium]